MFGAFQTFGKLGAIGKAISAAWSPLALWPNGAASPGMWIDPSLLTASFNDYLGTTPVSVPGTVADSANPVGLALDIRAGAPEVLGPELCAGAPSLGTGWTDNGNGTYTSDGNAGYISWPGAVAGKMYQVSITCHTFSGTWLAARMMDDWVPFATSVGTFTAKIVNANGIQFYSAGFAGIASFSCKEIPGNHMLQATSSARPLESARVNLLTYTEDFSFYQYSKNNVTTTGKIITTTGTDNCQIGRDTGARAGGKVAFTTTVKKGKSFAIIASDAAANGVAAGFDGTTGAYFASGSVGSTYSVAEYSCVTDDDPDFWLVGVVFNTGASGASNCAVLVNTHKVTSWGWSGCSTIGDTLEIGTGFHYQLGGTVSPYQPVLADTTYTSTGITPFQLYDGVDDGMATASFAAGTLINGMDCMIPVRRDSVANCVAGLYNGISDATKFFGMAESASGSGCAGSGAGTPTVWVDNTQLTGGTAVTRGTLHTALTVGSYHILEFRNLDLSTWTATGFGLYSSYVFPGARGDIMLYPSTASTEDKDAARQYLANKYGVTLA